MGAMLLFLVGTSSRYPANFCDGDGDGNSTAMTMVFFRLKILINIL